MTVNRLSFNNNYQTQQTRKPTYSITDNQQVQPAAVMPSSQSETTILAPNTSLRWHPSASEMHRMAQTDVYNSQPMDKLRESEIARIVGMTGIVVGKNELVVLLQELQSASANGDSLESVLERWSLNRPQPCGIRGDVFWIDPDTGEVRHAEAAGKLLDRNVDAVWDLAYDLQEFLRYTFFRQDGDCAETAAQILEEIIARQENKCVARFHDEEDDVENDESDYAADIPVLDTDMTNTLMEALKARHTQESESRVYYVDGAGNQMMRIQSGQNEINIKISHESS